MSTATPEVLWAQRSSDSDAEHNYVHLTLQVADVPKEDVTLDLQPTKLIFKGTSTSKKVTYAVDLEFFAEVDPKESKINHTSRNIELVLRKKDLKEEFWPRLLKDSKKVHFLKTNFDKWVDEDEQDDAPEDEDYMSKMNPMGGAGGEGGGDGGFGGIDFSKLAAAQGAGGFPGMPNMPDMSGMEGMEGGDSTDDDDEEMPELESEEGKPEAGKPEADKAEANEPAAEASKPAAEASSSKPKIEEVA